MTSETLPKHTYPVCPKCHKRVGKDKAKSTPEWTVYPARCPKCHQGLLETLLGMGLHSKPPKPVKETKPKRTRPADQAAADLDAAAAAHDADQPKNKGGRPTKLTKELIDDAAAYIMGGAYAVTVARALGITEACWYGWLDRGRKAALKPVSKCNATDLLCIQFERMIDQADAMGELKLGMLPSMGALGWQGAAWTMERKWPDRWGRARSEAPQGGTLDSLVEAIGKARAANG